MFRVSFKLYGLSSFSCLYSYALLDGTFILDVDGVVCELG